MSGVIYLDGILWRKIKQKNIQLIGLNEVTVVGYVIDIKEMKTVRFELAKWDGIYS